MRSPPPHRPFRIRQRKGKWVTEGDGPRRDATPPEVYLAQRVRALRAEVLALRAAPPQEDWVRLRRREATLDAIKEALEKEFHDRMLVADHAIECRRYAVDVLRAYVRVMRACALVLAGRRDRALSQELRGFSELASTIEAKLGITGERSNLAPKPSPGRPSYRY